MAVDTTQARILAKLAEVLLPPLPVEAALCRQQGDDVAAEIFEFPGEDKSVYRQCAKEALGLAQKHLSKDKLSGLKLILWLLSTRLGTLLLCGWRALSWRAPFVSTFERLPGSKCEKILLSWKHSALQPMRQIFKALHGLVMFTLFSMHNNGHSQLWDAIGYPGPDPFRPKQPSLQKQHTEKALLKSLISLQEQSLAAVKYDLREAGLQAQQTGSSLEISCDVVVVGSGCGGSVTAAILAEAGLKVLVVEKGSYTPAAELSTLERDAYDTMYEKGGLMMASEDGSMIIMAGSTVGGGSRINWSVSFRTPDHVRKDWATTHGLPRFATTEYTDSLDAVCSRLGVQTGVKHNRGNAALWKGLDKLGLDVEEMPRNCSQSDSCGHCPHGCASGQKQDATATYLVDAAKHGCVILSGAVADQILTEDSSSSHQKKAVGVLLHSVSDPAVCIKVLAPTVVGSSGSLNTPALLLRSNIKCQGNVGRHLHLHCATAVAAEFPEKRPEEDENLGKIKLWEGPQMSTYSRQVANWQTTGYGPLVSMTVAHPGLMTAGSPWTGAVDFRRNMSRLPWMAASCVYVRDVSEGTVTLDKEGGPSVNYWPCPRDQKAIIDGLEVGVRAMAAGGAKRIIINLHEMNQNEVFIDRTQDGEILHPEQIDKYVNDMRRAGLRQGRDSLFSLHQMGSCRMGASPRDSVVDPEGQCWECSGLYLADASVFPTASGVNPMITTYAISHMIATGLAKKLKSST